MPAHVTTFYSFKGGVGRSLLLANVGWLLAERARVVLVDLDVEAPGLHRVPALRTVAERGFFEWLHDWQDFEQLRATGCLSKTASESLRRLVRPVEGRPNLAILPAFGEGADPARLYSEGPWHHLLVEEPALGLALFDAVLRVIGDGRDHVLLDSRTGFTDIGGFLAALVPHATVLVGGYGEQNLAGLALVKQALETAAREPLRHRLDPAADLQLVHVVSPVPADIELSTERRQLWRNHFGEAQPIEVPFDLRLLWSERLLAADDPECEAAQAYRAVAARVSTLRSRLESHYSEVAEEVARYPLDFEPGRRMAKGLAFEDRVKRLLDFHGYNVEAKQLLGGNEVDLVARKTGGLDEECWWVECKDHKRPVGKDALERLSSWVSGKEGKAAGARGMVVARAFTPAATSFAADHPELRIWTLEQLERRLFDPAPYLNSLVTAFETSPLGRTYVEQRVLLEKPARTEAKVDLLEHALSWVEGEGQRLWLLLGDYGTGKSAFFQRFSYELARRALADPEAPFPLAINLKDFANAVSAETLLFEHLRRRLPNARIDPAALLHLLSTGRCLLLLDSFDEMGVAAAGRRVEDQFRELARLAGEEPIDPRRGNRVLILSRTHFFRDQQQVKDTATGRVEGLSAAADSALGQVARRFNAAIDELDIFGDEQVKSFVVKHLGEAEGARALEFIAKTYDLKNLSRRAVLLEMIVQSLPTLWAEKKEKVTPASLYEAYTRRWLEDTTGPNLQTKPVLRHRLLSLLASTLWQREDRQIHHRDLLAEVRKLAPLFPGLDFDRVDLELRTAAFLVRSADGYYRFSHKSFLEYFLARGLWDALAEPEGAADALDLPPLSKEVGEFFWQLPEDGREERLATLKAVLTAPYRARASENALRLGAWSLKGAGAEEERFEVEGAQLAGAQLAGVSLRACSLRRSDLRGADLERADLIDADLSGASLEGAQLNQLSGRGVKFLEANLSRASLVESELTLAKFSGADLTLANLAKAGGDQVIFHGSNLRGAKLCSSVWTETDFADSCLDGADLEGWVVAGERGMPKGVSLRWRESSELRVEFVRHALRQVMAVAFSPDNLSLATGHSDGALRFWDLASGELVRLLALSEGQVMAVAFAPDGRIVASGHDDSSVRFWEASNGKLLHTVPGSGGRLLSVAWSPSGNRLAVGSLDGATVLLNIPPLGRSPAIAVLNKTADHLWSVDWSPDGEILAAGSWDGSIVLTRVLTGENWRVATGAAGAVRAVAWSPTGSKLAAVGAEGSLHVLDSSSGKRAGGFEGPQGSVFCAAWSPDGSLLATGGAEGSVRLWDGATVTPAQVLVHAEGAVASVAWSPDGRFLAVASSGGSATLWALGESEPRASFLAWGHHAVATVPGGWYAPSTQSKPLNRLALRLRARKRGASSGDGWQHLSMAGLWRWLESPRRVRAALAGEPQPPPDLSGPPDV